MERQEYLPPEVEVLCVQVEHGYAASDTYPISGWDRDSF